MNNLLRLNIASSIFQSARMFSGSISLILLLESNISISVISLSKVIQLFFTSFLLLPIGMLGDKLGKKSIILYSCIFAIFYFVLLLFPSKATVFAAEICNGISFALYIGAYDSWLFSEKNTNSFLQTNELLASLKNYLIFP